MTTTQDMKAMIEGAIEDLRGDPNAGKGTASTVVTWTAGVASRIEDGPWRFVADEMEGDGGFGLGPDPGVFARAGLGSCLVGGYIFWAAVQDIPITALKVVVEGDYNARAMYGLEDENPPGFSEVRYRVEIESPAPAARVQAMIEHADRYSSVLDVFARAVPVKREVILAS